MAIITGASAFGTTLRGTRLRRLQSHFDGTLFAQCPFMDMGRRGLLNIRYAQLITHFAFAGIEGDLRAPLPLKLPDLAPQRPL